MGTAAFPEKFRDLNHKSSGESPIELVPSIPFTMPNTTQERT